MCHPTLIIADDEEAICFSLAREARRHGLLPLVASDGEQAVVQALGCESELVAVILDVRMPRRNGISAAIVLREECQTVSLAPMTAYAETPLPSGLESSVRIIYKPFELSIFSDWLTFVVARREAAIGCVVGELDVPPRAGAA
jgi:DNA-binding response OmpR family regulator